MNSKMTKLAAAAVIIVAVLIGMHFVGSPFGATVTFADVITNFLNAQTAEFDLIIGEEGKNSVVIHDIVKGTRIRRTLSNLRNISIIDLEGSKVLTLEPNQKIAIYLDVENLPQHPDYLGRLRNRVTELENDPNFTVEKLGENEIDGQQAIGFLATSPKAEVVIWTDPETALPIRIEHKQHKMKLTYKNFEFDQDFDDSLFSMDIPEGYSQLQQKLNLQNSTEEDFIEGLRILAQADGVFPEDVSVEYYIKNARKIGHKLETLATATNDSEAMAAAMKLWRYVSFIRFFKGESNWHYAGVGVELGNAETPIFWYRPKDSETWRVIYGDLHVEDVEEENLPGSELSNRQAKILESSEQWEKQEFVSTEKDVWRITSSGDIVAHSDITLTKISQDTNVIYIKLPYANAVLEIAKIGDKEILFGQVMKERYELELPAEDLRDESTRIDLIWSMPLETLTKVDYGYRINLQGLIPVESFELSVVLEPGCGLKYSADPSQTQMVLFKSNKMLSFSDNASCGLPVEMSQ